MRFVCRKQKKKEGEGAMQDSEWNLLEMGECLFGDSSSSFSNGVWPSERSRDFGRNVLTRADSRSLSDWKESDGETDGIDCYWFPGEITVAEPSPNRPCLRGSAAASQVKPSLPRLVCCPQRQEEAICAGQSDWHDARNPQYISDSEEEAEDELNSCIPTASKSSGNRGRSYAPIRHFLPGSNCELEQSIVIAPAQPGRATQLSLVAEEEARSTQRSSSGKAFCLLQSIVINFH